MRPTIVLATDCDDTVAPDTTTWFLRSRGIDTDVFWRTEVKAMLADGWDPSMAYLENILAKVGEGKPLGKLSNADLAAAGSTLDSILYTGVATIREELQAIAANIIPDVLVEWYVISGGMKALVEACPVIKDNCAGVYGCEFEEDPSTGCISRLKRCITYTEKTRCLFEINKGISLDRARTNPYAVNEDTPERKRRVPFQNMIYIGDGLTDIASFSMLKKHGGIPFGVFNPEEESSAQRALVEFMSPDRVVGMHAPRYGKRDELGSLLRAAVVRIAKRIKSERPVTNFEPSRLTPGD